MVRRAGLLLPTVKDESGIVMQCRNLRRRCWKNFTGTITAAKRWALPDLKRGGNASPGKKLPGHTRRPTLNYD